METTFANIDKAKEILGWTPKIDVRIGFVKTYE